MCEPKLSVVGAGPGDPLLITLKAVKALEKADVVLYDALANEELLRHAPDASQKVFVGKRAGVHYQQQDAINEMIVAYAKKPAHVVRLKGGDPMVFGRGHEELCHAALHGIPGEYIPGISSPFAVPGLAGIPLTHVEQAKSFWVLTGTLKDRSLTRDLTIAASSSATVVILMGMKKLDKIMGIFEKHRGSSEMVAVIQNGTLSTEKRVVGRVCEMVGKVNGAGLTSPAIIVVGPTVNRLLPEPEIRDTL
ncbi:uroporphyrinogen-III C-methyltransferase [Pleomorphovibrio marinus]|uniref:uroporphyrinogen-III C-methyltransferase n=1 Tax=Pleomorphovibrio marinus TaxID=2164132 RepID=UPI000E0B17D0|nr:uroporphyrinogen-III C-methyltransferase [Pleomorphovibrio marinus]